MKKEDFLQFEPDDASKMGINGKQVFFTKRINGKTTHNKLSEEEIEKINEQNHEKNDEQDDLFIQFKTPQKQQNNYQHRPTNNTKRKKSKKKKKRKIKPIAKLILLVIIFIGIIIFAMISPMFNIKKIEVIGNEKLSSDTIISLSGVSEGKNIFRISKKDITKKIKEDSYINSVSIKRKIPSTLEITVKERKKVYQIKVINSYVYLDYQGYILEVSAKDGKVPIIEGLTTEQNTLLNGKRVNNDDIEALETILKITDIAKSTNILKLINKIKVQNGEYLLELQKENKTVYLGKDSDLTNKIVYLKAIIKAEKGKKGIIFLNGDLNNGFKPFFREEIEKKEEKKTEGKE